MKRRYGAGSVARRLERLPAAVAVELEHEVGRDFAASNRLIGLCCCVSRGPRESASSPWIAPPPFSRSTIGWSTEVIWSPSITSCSRQRVWKSACIFWILTLSHASLTTRETTRSAMISGLLKTTAYPTVTFRFPRR